MHHNTKLDQEALLMGVCLLESSPIFHWIYHETKLQIDFESIKITVISLVILFGLRMIIVVIVIWEKLKCTNLCWELLFRRYIRFTLPSWGGSHWNLSNATCSTGAFLRRAFYLWNVCRSAVEVACMEFKLLRNSTGQKKPYVYNNKSSEIKHLLVLLFIVILVFFIFFSFILKTLEQAFFIIIVSNNSVIVVVCLRMFFFHIDLSICFLMFWFTWRKYHSISPISFSSMRNYPKCRVCVFWWNSINTCHLRFICA